MRIESHAVGAVAKYAQVAQFAERTQAKKATSYDKVELSQDAITFANMIKQVKTRGAQDNAAYTQRVEQISQMVHSGTYVLDASKVVDKLLV